MFSLSMARILFLGFLISLSEENNYSNIFKTHKITDFFSVYLIDRHPLTWDETRPCDKDHQGDFCDYQEFRNSPKDSSRHEIRTEDQFNMKMVEFWDDLLES